MISHHILCAGTASVAFARASARSIRLAALSGPDTVPTDPPRIFIHADGLPRGLEAEICAWLAAEPGTHVTHGLPALGSCPSNRQQKLINTHQHMINAVCRHYAFEPAIAFVDADLFLTDARWFGHLGAFASSHSLFGITWGLRPDRTLTLGDNSAFAAMKTNLFALRPQVHTALNAQRSNTDRRAADALRREFPSATLALGAGLDTMVAVSLRAQGHGFSLVDVEKSTGACHIGGFSHLDPRKLRHGGSGVSPERWLRRLRLMESVLRLFDSLGWMDRVDPALQNRAGSMRKLVDGNSDLAARIETLKPNADERAFGEVKTLLGC